MLTDQQHKNGIDTHCTSFNLLHVCKKQSNQLHSSMFFLFCFPSKAEKCYRVPLVECMREKKRRYESVLKLAKFLIAKDTSWEYSETAVNLIDPRSHKYRLMLDVLKSQEKEEQDGVARAPPKIAESPLILATKSGCTEIVEEILKTYPQAVEYVDSKGRNVLHVAIKYRQMQIFDIVEKMGMPMRRLKRKVTNQGNSILHMVGVKDHGIADMRSPALLLQENLLLFEVKLNT